MTPRARQLIGSAALILFAGMLVWGLLGVPGFGRYRGPYGDVINAVAGPERHVTNMATAVNFDYRAFDTLGEEFILFTAVTGLALLLRPLQGEQECDPPEADPDRQVPPKSDVVRWLCLLLIGLTNVFGLYVVLHAHLTPGGGFQGGALLGTACLLVFLAADYAVFHKVAPKTWMDIADAAGAGGYALIGIGSLLAGGAFLQNMMRLGKTGELLSGGMILPINCAVGLEVAGGFILLFTEFLKGEKSDKEKP